MTPEQRAEQLYPYPDKDNYGTHVHWEIAKERIDALRAAYIKGAESRWISVSESLPEPQDDLKVDVMDVLCLCEGNTYQLCYFPVSKTFYCSFPIKNYWEDWTDYVTHWQPLPAPPNQNDNNG